MKKIGSKNDESPTQLIDARIEELRDWCSKMLSRLRHDGIICTGETYKAVVKLTFFKAHH